MLGWLSLCLQPWFHRGKVELRPFVSPIYSLAFHFLDVWNLHYLYPYRFLFLFGSTQHYSLGYLVNWCVFCHNECMCMVPSLTSCILLNLNLTVKIQVTVLACKIITNWQLTLTEQVTCICPFHPLMPKNNWANILDISMPFCETIFDIIILLTWKVIFYLSLMMRPLKTLIHIWFCYIFQDPFSV